MFYMCFKNYLFLLCVVCFHHAFSQSIEDITALKQHLLANSSYDKTIRPVLDRSRRTQVKMKASIQRITSFDVTNGKVVFTGHMAVVWHDELLTWNENEFGGVSEVVISNDKIWMPELRQVADKSGELDISSAWVNNNGTVSIIVVGGFIGFCDLDVYYYPMDMQTCTTSIVVVNNDASEVNLTVLLDKIDTYGFSNHGEWALVETNAADIRFQENELNRDFVAYVLELKLKRRPDFVMIHTLVPVLLTGLLNTMIYYVPIKSGERLSYAITVLLTFVFFTTNLTMDLPKVALIIPIYSILMAFMNCLCTFNVIVSVIFCRLADEKVLPVPDCVKRFVRKLYYKELIKRRGVIPKCSNTVDIVAYLDQKEPVNHSNTKESGDEKVMIEDNSSEADKDLIGIEITWNIVMDVFDMIMFYLHLFVIIISGMVFTILITSATG